MFPKPLLATQTILNTRCKSQTPDGDNKTPCDSFRLSLQRFFSRFRTRQLESALLSHSRGVNSIIRWKYNRFLCWVVRARPTGASGSPVSLLIHIPLNICHGFVRSCLSVCLGEIVSIVANGRGKEVVIKNILRLNWFLRSCAVSLLLRRG